MNINYSFGCACNDVTHKAERRWSAGTFQGLKNFFQEREMRLLVIATSLCLLAKDQDTLIEQSLL